MKKKKKSPHGRFVNVKMGGGREIFIDFTRFRQKKKLLILSDKNYYYYYYDFSA